MQRNDKVEEISNKIKEIINSTPLTDLDKNLHALIQGIFTKMELVSRDEFEIQAKVLQRTREKLEKLEKTLAQLEKSTKK